MAIAWSPDSERIASGDSLGTLKLWDANDGREVLSLKCGDGKVQRIVWSPDGTRLFVSVEGNEHLMVLDAYPGFLAERLPRALPRLRRQIEDSPKDVSLLVARMEISFRMNDSRAVAELAQRLQTLQRDGVDVALTHRVKAAAMRCIALSRDGSFEEVQPARNELSGLWNLYNAEAWPPIPANENGGVLTNAIWVLRALEFKQYDTAERIDTPDDYRNLSTIAKQFDESACFLAMRGIAELRSGHAAEAIALFEKSQTMRRKEFIDNSARNLRNKVCQILSRIRSNGTAGRKDYANGILADLPAWLGRHEEVQEPNPEAISALSQYLAWYDELVDGRLLLYSALAHHQLGQSKEARDAYNQAVSRLLCQPTVDELTLTVWAEAALTMAAKRAQHR